MAKKYIIAFVAAIGLSYFLVSPWVLLFYLYFLAIATVVVLTIVVLSLSRRTNQWKTALLNLSVGYVAVLSSYCISSYLNTRIINERDYSVASLYQYRDKFGHFPPASEKLSSKLTSIRGNYVPDSALQNFILYTRDIYGFPWVFSSKDSTWER